MIIPKGNGNFTSNNYYMNNYMMSHAPRYWYFVTIGSRGRGKTYSGKKQAIKMFLKQVERGVSQEHMRKFMWWRLTDGAIVKILENNGASFFERSLLDQYEIIVKVVNDDIFFARRQDYIMDDEEKIYNYYHVGKAGSIQSYYKNKGNQFNDYDLIIMDELVRAESEKRSFNIPRAFINSIENVCRKRKGLKVLIYANAIGEMQEVRQLFGFMPFPGKFGVYKLYHKRTIIEYLDDSSEWKEEQAQTMSGILASSSEFTNVHVSSISEREDFFIERKHSGGKRYFCSIKIDTGLWLDVHLLRGYYWIDTTNYTNKASAHSNNYALDRTLVSSQAKYSQEFIKLVRQIWEISKFRFASPISYEWFTKALERYSII